MPFLERTTANVVPQLPAPIMDTFFFNVFWSIGAGERDRTAISGLEGLCSTIELHPRI